jgi:hypothetical protein
MRKWAKINVGVGEVYGKLTVVKDLGTRMYSGGWHRFVFCKCECGGTKEVLYSTLKKGATQSCGCLWRNKFVRHGLCSHPLYRVWQAIKRRCYSINDAAYLHYGGRGIKVCRQWKHKAERFIEWASSNGWEKGLQIDRIDNNKGYSPENCRIVTRKENMNNTRRNITLEYNGEVKTLTEWANCLKINSATLHSRIFRHEKNKKYKRKEYKSQ